MDTNEKCFEKKKVLHLIDLVCVCVCTHALLNLCHQAWQQASCKTEH